MIQKTEIGDGRLRPMRKSLPAMTALCGPISRSAIHPPNSANRYVAQM